MWRILARIAAACEAEEIWAYVWALRHDPEYRSGYFLYLRFVQAIAYILTRAERPDRASERTRVILKDLEADGELLDDLREFVVELEKLNEPEELLQQLRKHEPLARRVIARSDAISYIGY